MCVVRVAHAYGISYCRRPPQLIWIVTRLRSYLRSNPLSCLLQSRLPKLPWHGHAQGSTIMSCLQPISKQNPPTDSATKLHSRSEACNYERKASSRMKKNMSMSQTAIQMGARKSIILLHGRCFIYQLYNLCNKAVKSQLSYAISGHHQIDCILQRC